MVNEEFARGFAKYGHNWPFMTAENTLDTEFEGDGTSDDTSGAEESEKAESSDDEDPEEDAHDIYNWIRKVHNKTKGIELQGTVHPHLIKVVFHQQSQLWEKLSTMHLNEVKNIIDQYLKVTFRKVVTEPYVLQNLERFLRPRILEGHSKADEELRKLLEDERGGILQTVNHYFAETLANIRSDREIQRLKDDGYQEGSTYHMTFENLSAARNISNDDSAVYDIHDIVKSYYKVAMKRFLDNVVI